MRIAISCLIAILTLAPQPVIAACLSDDEIEVQLGAQIRAGARVLDTQTLADKPLCSGLTLAQAVQALHAKAFPEEQARIIEQDNARAASQLAAATERSQQDLSSPAKQSSPIYPDHSNLILVEGVPQDDAYQVLLHCTSMAIIGSKLKSATKIRKNQAEKMLLKLLSRGTEIGVSADQTGKLWQSQVNFLMSPSNMGEQVPATADYCKSIHLYNFYDN